MNSSWRLLSNVSANEKWNTFSRKEKSLMSKDKAERERAINYLNQNLHPSERADETKRHKGNSKR